MLQQIPVERISDLEFIRPPEIAEPDCRRSSELRRLNLNESLQPPSPNAISAMTEALASAESYPDHSCAALAALLASRTGISADRISFGNGSGELLSQAATLAMEVGDEAVFPVPTFPVCIKGVHIAGGKVIEVPVDSDGVNNVDAMLEAVTPKTRLFYLCTPNNPTGGAIGAPGLLKAIEKVPDDCLLLIDEAYHEFAKAEGSPEVLSLLKARNGPWAVTRSFSKAYCLAGMRVGYVITSSRKLCQAFWTLRGNFNVNRVALAGAVAAMKDEAYLQSTLKTLIHQRNRLAEGLQNLGFEIFPSQANFLTVKTPRKASALASHLAKYGLLVQSMPWPGGFGSLRVTIGDAHDVDQLLRHLGEILTG